METPDKVLELAWVIEEEPGRIASTTWLGMEVFMLFSTRQEARTVAATRKGSKVKRAKLVMVGGKK